MHLTAKPRKSGGNKLHSYELFFEASTAGIISLMGIALFLEIKTLIFLDYNNATIKRQRSHFRQKIEKKNSVHLQNF
ncbi:hypothetical protein BpHYR1_030867 [Brachionus plicatilis]|uniref:Uncharacterized protein n=1 Tax=Brachionus plicatilis TaxID=10195 RepID=A0A3M7PXZ4_BRAPC|nr:hypothetical protein BpHYR1_030867 [Brachionus plicatilis]